MFAISVYGEEKIFLFVVIVSFAMETILTDTSIV